MCTCFLLQASVGLAQPWDLQPALSGLLCAAGVQTMIMSALHVLQEMYEEYGRAVQQAVGKPPRLRLFLTPAMEEDMTPEQYHDGNEFFAHAQDRFWCAPG